MANCVRKAPLIIQICTLVTKYWMRTENRSYMHTLVGEAAVFNIQSKTQAVIFRNYILKLCKFVSHVETYITSAKRDEKHIINLRQILVENY